MFQRGGDSLCTCHIDTNTDSNNNNDNNNNNKKDNNNNNSNMIITKNHGHINLNVHTTPGLHNKIPANKIFARVWVAQKSLFVIGSG